MLETRVHSELYDLLVNNGWTYQSQSVAVSVYRAKQVVMPKFPAIFIDYSDAVLDLANTPFNEIFEINTITAEDGMLDFLYRRGVVVQQSINLNLYDNDISRIAELQEQLFSLCKKMQLSNVTVFRVNPPKVLDFVEGGEYIYRRLVEVICKFVVWEEEVVKTIEEVETELL